MVNNNTICKDHMVNRPHIQVRFYACILPKQISRNNALILTGRN